VSLFSRNLQKYGKDIILEDRDARTVSGVMQEVFSNPATVKAITKTVSGVSLFDDTNTEVDITHRISIEYIAGLTSEKWVKLNGRRLRVVNVENCCEENKTMILRCTERGVDTVDTNNA